MPSPRSLLSAPVPMHFLQLLFSICSFSIRPEKESTHAPANCSPRRVPGARRAGTRPVGLAPSGGRRPLAHSSWLSPRPDGRRLSADRARNLGSATGHGGAEPPTCRVSGARAAVILAIGSDVRRKRLQAG